MVTCPRTVATCCWVAMVEEPAPPAWLINWCALHSLRIGLATGEDPANSCWMISSEGKADLGIFIWRDQAVATKMLMEYLGEIEA